MARTIAARTISAKPSPTKALAVKTRQANMANTAPIGAGWRDLEPSLAEVGRKYPAFPPMVLLKTDVQRRGVAYTPEALAHVNPAKHMTTIRSNYYDSAGAQPVSLTLRDGTSLYLEGFLEDGHREPYVVDHDGRRAFLTDRGEALEEVEYWEKPAFYDKFTRSGKPMWQIVSARPQRYTIHPKQFCDFWKFKGQGCKFCAMDANFRKNRKEPLLSVDDVVETVAEALKEPGASQSLFFTGGSLLGGKDPFGRGQGDPLGAELELYLGLLKALGQFFGNGKFPSQLISTAFDERGLRRLWEETGLMSYTADLEVLDEKLFGWICPGKAKLIGYRGWKERLVAAADIFGRGNVNTGLVGGVELAKPKGFATEDEALEATLSEAASLIKHGVWVVSCVWRVLGGSVFFGQKTPSLDYYARLSLGLDGLRRAANIPADLDNYRRCGNHPDTDLARV
ncbi:MAG: radical SAM protein [Deltaproteobacteria bacterium]|jgi:hypothetical protein|nr:radical SAM protein [Deltaproteobacteria bacterium]